MTAKFFVDTNILLYAASNAPDDQLKRAAARALLAQPDVALSAQVRRNSTPSRLPSSACR